MDITILFTVVDLLTASVFWWTASSSCFSYRSLPFIFDLVMDSGHHDSLPLHDCFSLNVLSSFPSCKISSNLIFMDDFNPISECLWNGVYPFISMDKLSTLSDYFSHSLNFINNCTSWNNIGRPQLTRILTIL